MITRLVCCGCKVKGIEELEYSWFRWRVFVSLHFCGMLAVRSLVEGDLSIDCRRWHGFGMLRVSRQAEVGSKSWRHKWGVWTVKTPTTCLEMSIESISTGWGWEWVLETQVRCLDNRRSDNWSGDRLSKEKSVRWLGWQVEVGSRSWRHKWSVWTIETPTTGLEVFESKSWETTGFWLEP